MKSLYVSVVLMAPLVCLGAAIAKVPASGGARVCFLPFMEMQLRELPPRRKPYEPKNIYEANNWNAAASAPPDRARRCQS
ncbi:hypothetical protein Msil_3342 [Methylocella silvestris BL2]|uniref:Uncharacterized protein n=1 Tax=Methylocella silvestris (strain DSM 15510 / CIP 108128 / LMG 27833 / NCIMB 13906 / BL2) TaxID=395965 RepID=B8ES33_METSB|nr:hypothetical protein [Methylocella silvestris]ACK52248.1 hypothetical protein Msil_3342 [Methylocella silvestris BL2]